MKGMLSISFVIFVLCALIVPFCASAQCGDCDDKNPCTKDYCNGTKCLHEPTTCSDVRQSEKPFFGRDGITNTHEGADNSKLPVDSSNPSGDNSNPSVDNSKPQVDSSKLEADDGNPPIDMPSIMNIDVPKPINCENNNSGAFNAQDFSRVRELAKLPVTCDDNNACTRDSWDGTACVNTPISCDDGNISTVDYCGPAGCVNNPLNTDDAKVGPAESCIACLSEALVNSVDVNATTKEAGITAEESQSSNRNISAYPNCDDGNPCTIDTYDGTSCVYTQKNCDDGSEGTLDSCEAGVCVNKPKGTISGNNSTAMSESAKLYMWPPNCDDGDPCTVDSFNGTGCEHRPKNCDDGNASTFDYCYGGTCIHTQKSCDDGKPCTIDSYNGTECVHKPMNCDDANACTVDYCDGGSCMHKPKVCNDGKACTADSCDPEKGCVATPKNCDDGNACTVDACDGRGNCVHMWRNCNDGNPCTIDECDPNWGCIHTPVVCGAGKTCVNGVCQAVSTPSIVPNIYIIPPGSSINLPWGTTVTAIDPTKVENGIAYTAGLPIKISRQLGYDQAASAATSINQAADHAEMVGLSWQSNPFSVTLVKPDGSILSPDSDRQNIKHITGINYDYYFIRNPVKGEWNIEIRPVNPGARGEGFSLITGLVAGSI